MAYKPHLVNGLWVAYSQWIIYMWNMDSLLFVAYKSIPMCDTYLLAYMRHVRSGNICDT